MVRDYLPELLTETEERLSDAARGILFDAVERRNTFVHAGEKAHKKFPRAPESGESLKVLGMASDMLWLFDSYRGQPWALQNLGWADRQSLAWLNF